MTTLPLISRPRRRLLGAAGLALLLLLAVAPAAHAVAFTTNADVLFAPTRVGTSSSATATTLVTNTSGTVTGTFGTPVDAADFNRSGTGIFTVSGFHFLTPRSATYNFTPTSRGTFTSTAPITSNASNSPTTVRLGSFLGIPVPALGVGPVYSSSPAPGSIINFGDVMATHSASLPLDISNTTTDVIPIVLPAGDPRTRLTLESFTITGPNAADFSFDLPPGSTIDALGPTLDQLVTFHPALGEVGLETATLTIFTDQGAALGGAGASFTYTLQGVAVPEPATLTLLGLGLLGGAVWRRRRRANA